ncbi:MAG: L-seryl-tRNA(Sec) selenium transferase [Planctomycetes bacterium]|jgi:L-seryl-tRNA(Ser) seleniumtransferase|nr:L-seryl-tRNA(Sec) selenium transferase [Planctomycetota bacterium]MDP6409236.1 L-seryl-tRNA(Sec) selenium transferase [Planctomycetota bacterium]
MAAAEERRGEAFRLLPGVDEASRLDSIAPLVEGAEAERELVLGLVRGILEEWRAEIVAGQLDAETLAGRLEGGELARGVASRLARERGGGLWRVVNATGVVLHTGLGRAPVHPEVASAMARAAVGYCVLEVDRFSGARNERDAHLGTLLERLTGAEAGIAVNNNAGAVLLCLQTFAAGRAAVVSRGELVEIGGSFRVPEIMARAGVSLREVGTTNRTRAADYERAAGDGAGLLMKVHTSNYRVVGFTGEVDPAELAEIGRSSGTTTAFDLGSGLLEAAGSAPLDMLGAEPLVRDAVASGIDVVTFSGDKLLGGPQAGLLVGRRAVIDALRRNPIYRALRCDKVTLAGLEATLELYLAGRADELPARRLLRASAAELEPVAARVARFVAALEGFEAEVVPGRSQPGSGSAPGVFLDTPVVCVRHTERSPDELAAALRAGDPPVFARIHDERLHLDPRALLEGDEERLATAFELLASG